MQQRNPSAAFSGEISRRIGTLQVDGAFGVTPEEMAMRSILLLLVSVTLFVTAVMLPQPASAARYCLQGKDWGYPGNCQFFSYDECMASASGTFAYCGINPRYAYARQWRGYWYPGFY